jgi:hypothetical protein
MHNSKHSDKKSYFETNLENNNSLYNYSIYYLII